MPLLWEENNMNIGFAGLLTLIFIVLKLTEVVAWSWLWVLSPLWIGFAIWFLLSSIVVFFFSTRK
jgi:hypothetical protein